MDKIYICQTVYHIYITLVKCIVNDRSAEHTDIMILDTIPNYRELAERIRKSGVFYNVYIFESSKIDFPKIYKNKLSQKRKIVIEVENICPVSFKSYKDIYLYQDMDILGVYLIASKIFYNLIEDSLNNFKNISQKNSGFYYLNPVVIFIKNTLKIGFCKFGFSKYCKSIEVNEKEGIEIPLNKVIEIPREQLLCNLTDKNKKHIYSIFIGSDNSFITNKSKTVLLLTEPFYLNHKLENIEQQVILYSNLINEYKNKGYTVIIKPHPRDIIDYQNIFPDFKILDKAVPTEILNFNSKINYDLAITISSSAIEGLLFANQKITLGLKTLENYRLVTNE